MVANAREPRWSGARLWVYTVPLGSAPCSIIVRRQEGTRDRDTLWGRAAIPFEAGSRASQNPEYALCLALAHMLPPEFLLHALGTVHDVGVVGAPGGATGATVSPLTGQLP